MFWGQIFEVEILMDLHVLRILESKKHFLAFGLCVCASVCLRVCDCYQDNLKTNLMFLQTDRHTDTHTQTHRQNAKNVTVGFRRPQNV